MSEMSDMKFKENTMYELFEKTARAYPKEIAVSFMGTDLSYEKLCSQVNDVSHAFMLLGAAQGDVVSICLPNVPHVPLAFYAANKLGLIANMIHPLTPAYELAEIVKKTDSKFLVILDAFFSDKIEALKDGPLKKTIVCSISDYLSPLKQAGFYLTKGRKIPKWDFDESRQSRWANFLASGTDHAKIKSLKTPEDDRDNQEKFDTYSPAVYLHSGGTTDLPKTIVLSSMNMNALGLQAFDIAGIGSPVGTKIASILPFFHGFGLCIGMHSMLINGATSALMPIFSPTALAEMLKKDKPQFIAAVPTLLEGIMGSKLLKNMDLSFIKAVFCGGDTLTPALKEKFDNFLADHNCQAQVREGYGLTETVTVCTVNPAEDNRAGTVGKALQGISLKIIDPETGADLPFGEKGEICVTGPTVMLEYLNDPEATAAAVKKHADGKDWVHTGDLGFLNEEGYLTFIQRLKRIIKVSGIAVFPSTVEDAVMQVKGVAEAAVIGVSHPYKMQVVKAFVVAEPGVKDLEALKNDIIEHCSERMIKHSVPAEIEFLKEFPKTKVGKIDVKELEKREES